MSDDNMHREVNKVFHEVMDFMEADITYYIRYKLSPMVKKKIRGSEIVSRFSEEDPFHAIVLKLILLREALNTCVILRNETLIYFARVIFRIVVETLQDIEFLLKKKDGRKKYTQFLKNFYSEGILKDGKLELKNIGPTYSEIGRILGESEEKQLLHDILSKFVHGNAHTIIGYLAGEENDSGGYTFGALSKKNKNLANLTRDMWSIVYISLCIFIKVRIESGSDSEYFKKSKDLRQRFKMVGKTYNLNLPEGEVVSDTSAQMPRKARYT